MLDIQDLHIRFRNAPEGREAVKGISLHMDEGEILGLVGESGSGKTVTAMALAGLLSHAKTELSGAIFFQGLDRSRPPGRRSGRCGARRSLWSFKSP